MSKVYVDLDCTLNNAHERIREVYDKEIYEERFVAGRTLLDLPLPGAKDAVKRLAELYDDVIVFTARFWKNAVVDTQMWLQLHTFPVMGIITTDSVDDKLKWLKEDPPDLLIDDLSREWETKPPWTSLYDDAIHQIERMPFPFIRFKGDWADAMRRVESLEDNLR